MIDILVYLFETYGYADACPEEPEQLTRKLVAVGFDEADIANAIDWLHGLRMAVRSESRGDGEGAGSTRVFSDAELERLDVGSRGFLAFLESAGVVDQHRRELIIDRAMALPGGGIDLSQFKVIVLMVLWQERASIDALILDELLTDEVDDPDEAWHDTVTLH